MDVENSGTHIAGEASSVCVGTEPYNRDGFSTDSDDPKKDSMAGCADSGGDAGPQFSSDTRTHAHTQIHMRTHFGSGTRSAHPPGARNSGSHSGITRGPHWGAQGHNSGARSARQGLASEVFRNNERLFRVSSSKPE